MLISFTVIEFGFFFSVKITVQPKSRRNLFFVPTSGCSVAKQTLFFLMETNRFFFSVYFSGIIDLMYSKVLSE